MISWVHGRTSTFHVRQYETEKQDVLECQIEYAHSSASWYQFICHLELQFYKWKFDSTKLVFESKSAK